MARITSVTVAVGEPDHQLADPQLVRADAVDRADRPAEHVVAAAELAGPLDRDDVLGLLDDAQHASGRGAGRGRSGTAPPRRRCRRSRRTGPCSLTSIEHVGEPAYVGRVGREQVERDPLGALGTDAGQPAELVDQVLDHAFVQRGLPSEPGEPPEPLGGPPKPNGWPPPGSSPAVPPPSPPRPSPSPPVSGPSCSPASASALRLGVAAGGHDHVAEVGEVVGVAAVEAAGPDLDADQLAGAADRRGDRAARDGAVDLGLGERAPGRSSAAPASAGPAGAGRSCRSRPRRRRDSGSSSCLSPGGVSSCRSVVLVSRADLLDHLRAELALEQLGAGQRRWLDVEVVAVGVGVGRCRSPPCSGASVRRTGSARSRRGRR